MLNITRIKLIHISIIQVTQIGYRLLSPFSQRQTATLTDFEDLLESY